MAVCKDVGMVWFFPLCALVTVGGKGLRGMTVIETVTSGYMYASVLMSSWLWASWGISRLVDCKSLESNWMAFAQPPTPVELQVDSCCTGSFRELERG